MALSLFSSTTAVALVLYAIYRFFVYPVYLSPLSKIPNAHPTAAFSRAWILWIRYTMNNNKATLAAHQKHGPIVRLAPNELSINCVDDGLRIVYAGGFEKHDWYPLLFGSYGVVNMFSTIGHQSHSNKKRMMSNVYSKSYLQGSAQIAENSSILLKDRFLPFIHKYAEVGLEVDVHDMNNGFTMDFMSAYQYGLPSSTKFALDPATRKRILKQYHERRDYEFYSQEVPLLKRFSKMLGMSLVPAFVAEANAELEEWNIKLCDAATAYCGEDIPSPGAEPVVFKQVTAATQKQYEKSGVSRSPAEKAIDRRQVASEMLDHLGAGHETSAIALTYLYHELSQRPELQEKLRQELLSLSPQIVWPYASDTPSSESAFPLPHSKDIDALPLLHAVIMETLRLHAPIPGQEPRITPAGGCTLAGYANIPANVRVGAMPYTLHRNADVFPNPEAWVVERWLKPADSKELKEMLRWFWAFGSGGRMCVGSNLAMQEMKLLVAAIYTNYRTTIVNDDGIEEVDTYTTRPTSNRLMLKFDHIA